MKKVRIITDSACDLPGSFTEAHGIHVAPMRSVFSDGEYIDGVTITPRQFYEKLIECGEMPTTSQPAPVEFEEIFNSVRADGDEAVVITLSSKLSGTYRSVLNVLDADDTGLSDCIFPVDSLNATIGEGALVELAVLLRDEGRSAREIAEKLKADRGRLRLIALLNTLEYLKKGGRISKTAAFAGELLSIKPVVTVIEGEVKVIGKARGSKQGGNMLTKFIEETGGADISLPIRLGYTGLSDALLVKYMEDSSALRERVGRELPVDNVGSIIGAHVGPGAIAVAFFSRQEPTD